MIKKLFNLIFTKSKNYLREDGNNPQRPNSKRHLIEPETDSEDGLLCTIQCKLGYDYEEVVLVTVWREPTLLEAATIAEQRISKDLRQLFPGNIEIVDIICSDPNNIWAKEEE